MLVERLPEPPGPLDDSGKGYWYSIGDALIAQQRLPLTALPMFFQLCAAWSDYLDQQAAIKKMARKNRYTEDGRQYSAQYRDFLDSQKRYSELAKHFGLDVLPVMQTPTIVPAAVEPVPIDKPKAVAVEPVKDQPLDLSKSQAQFENAELTKRDRAKYQRNDYRGGLPIPDEQPPATAEVVHHRVEILVPSAAAVAEYQQHVLEFDAGPGPEQFQAAPAVATVTTPLAPDEPEDEDELGVIV